jgi:hypothetical protein
MNAMNHNQPIWCRTADELADALADQIPATYRADVIGNPRWRQGITEAWSAGWRDAAWLANMALAGSELPATDDPAASVIYHLLAASDIPCPEWRPLPPGIPPAEDPR